MKKNNRGCICTCYWVGFDDWDICICNCDCKSHRETKLDNEFWDKQEKKKLFFKSLRAKKEKEKLENDIDNIVFGKEE